MSRVTPERTDAAAIYAIAAELPDRSFVVKIGMTGFPYERYADLITAIPFPSAMKWSWVGMRAVAHVVEKTIHRQFDERNTAREWFHFQHAERKLLWEGIAAAVFACTDRLPDWQTITEEQVNAYCQAKAKPKGKAKKGFRPVDFSNRLARHERIF